MLEQWAAAIATPSRCKVHMRIAMLHDMGTKFIRYILNKSLKVWLAQAKARINLIKAHSGPQGMRAWALQRAERQEKRASGR